MGKLCSPGRNREKAANEALLRRSGCPTSPCREVTPRLTMAREGRVIMPREPKALPGTEASK